MKFPFFLTICFLLIFGCSDPYRNASQVSGLPDIFPDYTGIVIPYNIAPLNFEVKGAKQCYARFLSGDVELLSVKGKNEIRIPERKWKKMLAGQKGKTIKIQLFVCSGNQQEWRVYDPFEIQVSEEAVDSHITYRLIEPGYELWNEMGIYQRDLTSFEEKVIVHNSRLDKGCVNCHSFHQYDPNRFMLHVRKKGGGTLIAEDNKLEMVSLSTPKTIGNGTYPMWHPSGNYIVFSTNTTNQSFYAFQDQKVEVYDRASDLIFYDVRNKKVLVDDRFNEKVWWETFPAWSPDGKQLYMCRAESKDMPFEYKDLKYGIYRISFDPSTGVLGDSLETVFNEKESGKSASFPRISPDGRYLLYTLADCGTFPIWHKEADLKMIDLVSGREVDMDPVNSPDVESYHSWSSNGRWVIFSSRRTDGRYTRFYLSFFDKEGKIHKPFVLPQKDPRFYTRFLKSYNIPEFTNGETQVTPYQIEQIANQSQQ